MTERYYLTGVQLGMLKVFAVNNGKEILEHIEENQFIGNERLEGLEE